MKTKLEHVGARPTIAASPSNALRAAKIQVNCIRVWLHNARSRKQCLGVVCTELHQKGPAQPCQVDFIDDLAIILARV